MTSSSALTGVVVGAAVGDALGAPFEFKPPRTYQNRFPHARHDGTGELIGGGSYNWAPGEFTDDTQMGLILATSLLDNDLDLDESDLFRRWKLWAQSANDVGMTTRHALSFDDHLDVFFPDIERSAGNGALMRTFPLALIDCDEDVRHEMVLAQALLTHHHPDAGWGAWLAVAMIRGFLEGEDGFKVLDSELESLPTSSREIFAPLLRRDWDPSDKSLHNGTVWGCLADAVWAVRGATSFEDAVVRAVNLGDDADTVASVAGAIAGAKFTEQAIPGRWLAYVHGKLTMPNGKTEVVRVEELENIARALAGLTAPSPKLEPGLGPIEVHPRLFAANRSAAQDCPKDWAILSLCRTEKNFVDYEVRRQWYLIDNSSGNPNLAAVVDDVVRSIDSLLSDGKTVLVHCEGGRSRTCLALKAWAMKSLGLSSQEAHLWLTKNWPHCSGANDSFTGFLNHDWTARCAE